MTALHHASCYGHKNIVEYLLSNGSAIEAKDKDGWTALHWASYNSRKEVVKVLLFNGSDVNAKDNNGKTALEYATCDEIAALFSNHHPSRSSQYF